MALRAAKAGQQFRDDSLLSARHFRFSSLPQCVTVHSMKSPRSFRLFLHGLCWGLVAAASVAWADSPSIQTNREGAHPLPATREEDGFQFIIFGDRTGGPPEGVQVLAQAVEEANLLDPDLVMTVGDLVQGYNAQDLWETQMKEFRDTMNGLHMPWFPVAGNHDIYWRGDGRTDREHEANYETHFGPLWYWFKHKNAGFLVLFTDEGDRENPGKPRAFNDPAQQSFSPAQREWLQQALQEMKGLRHIFVFQHHPRWIASGYAGSDWAEIHRLLAANGNVRAVFSGHIHRMTYYGVQDGIEYYTLATTGGSLSSETPGLGQQHHFNLVTVRPQGIKVSALPVGALVDPKRFVPERHQDMVRARDLAPQPVSEPLVIAPDGLGAGVHEVTLANPSQRPLEVTLAAEEDPAWVITPPLRQERLEPGASRTFAFTCVRVKSAFAPQPAAPVFGLETVYVEEDARTPLPRKRFPAALRYAQLPEDTFAAVETPTALQVTAERSGVRVDASRFTLPDGPFTVEAWVYPESNSLTAGLVSKLQRAGYGLLGDERQVSFVVHLDGRNIVARAEQPLPLRQWTHVAGVFDGQSVTLYLNGQPAGQVAATGSRQTNDLPLYLGADPGAEGGPSRAFRGWVDEVRLSQTARYTEAFTPARRHEPDADTVLLFHLDRLVGGLAPDHSTSQAHGTPVGATAVKAAP